MTTFHRFANLTKPAKQAACPCIRCGGGGYVHSVVEGGVCFRCRGHRQDPTHRDWAFPQAWTDEQCQGFLDGKHEAAKARREAKAAQERTAAEACWGSNVEACPALVEFDLALRFAPGDAQKSSWPDVVRFWTDWEAQFAGDIVAKARHYRLSEKQTALVSSIRTKITERATKAAIEAETAVAVEPGRRQITGEVLSVKTYGGDYNRHYGRTVETVKVLLKCDGFKAFGTAPASIVGDVARGDRVTLTATIKPKEVGFVTFSRPTNATLDKPVPA
jgi:hypothetical protein